MAQHGAPTSIMDEKPLTPAARAGLVVNAAITILLFYLTAILFMAGFGAFPPLFLGGALFAAPVGVAPAAWRWLRGPRWPLWLLGRGRRVVVVRRYAPHA